VGHISKTLIFTDIISLIYHSITLHSKRFSWPPEYFMSRCRVTWCTAFIRNEACFCLAKVLNWTETLEKIWLNFTETHVEL